MKKLYLVRHAKSSWADLSQKDIDRPLNKRGEKDAPYMGELLKKRGVQPDLIISSPALRANTTAKIFAEKLSYSKEISINPDIYEAYIDDVLSVIHQVSNNINTVMIFGHNPTFTNLANYFHDEYIPNVPTCGIICIEADVNNWANINRQTGNLTSFDYPKLLAGNGV